MFLNTKTNQLHIVDYKSTSQKTEGREITLMVPGRKELEDRWIFMYGF